MSKKSDDNKKYQNKFNSFRNHKYTKEDINKLFDNENGILAKAATGKLAEYVDYIKLFFLMLKDTVTGKYKEIPKGTIASIIGTLLYVFSPIDLILDAIPVVGLADDAAIVALCIKATEADVKKYKAWKETSAALGEDYKEIN